MAQTFTKLYLLTRFKGLMMTEEFTEDWYNDPKLDDVIPTDVMNALKEHAEQYETDPEKAHLFDTGVVGVESDRLAPCLLLVCTGRKSGKEHSSVLEYFEFEGKVGVVGSGGGGHKNPGWYLNLKDHPECTIQIVRDVRAVKARDVSGDERRRWRDHVFSLQPIQRRYWSRELKREIPIVVFEE
jgi:deazaflavin-dependent oxidoreductase (nitroreductase family)